MMRRSATAKLAGLFLALFLAVPAGLCWDCCCAAELETAATSCCPKAANDTGSRTMSPASGCDCPDLAFDATSAAPAPTTQSSTSDHGHSASDGMLAIVDARSVEQSRNHDSTRPPARLSAGARLGLAPRAPPTLS